MTTATLSVKPTQREADNNELTLLGERGAAGLLRAFALIWVAIACASWGLVEQSNYDFLMGGLRMRPVYFGWLVGPLMLVLLQAGRVKAATATVIWSFALIPIFSALQVAGLHSHILVVPPIAVMTAGWLLGWRQAAILWVVVAASHFYLLAQHQAGYPYQPDTATIKDWLVFGFASTMALALGVFTMRSFRHQFGRVLGLSADLARQVQALRLSEAQFAEQFRANPLPSVIGDMNARLVDVNDAWVNTFGITRHEAIGRRADELGLWANTVSMDDMISDILHGGGAFGLPVHMRVANGEVRDFLTHVALIDTAQGKRYINMLIDQTDRLNAEAAQRALNCELESRVNERTAELQAALKALQATQQDLVRAETLASLGSMVAGISHELNTPLGNALTVVTTLQEKSAEIAAQAGNGTLRKTSFDSFLADTHEMSLLGVRSIQRATDLVASFKRVAVDQISEQRRTFDLNQAVDEIIATLTPGLIKGTAWKVELDVERGIHCDSYPGVVGQILTGLVQNAVRHGFGERTAGTLRIVAYADNKQLELSVADDGVGMDAATLAHVFDPFFTTQLGRGGSGLGLAICKRLAASVLGGDLHVTASPGAGSVFTLRMPLIAPGRV